MKWIGISGSRTIDAGVEGDVRRMVREILEKGDGIVTGGAMGVDYVATDEVFKSGLLKERLKACLPVTLDIYSTHYRKRSKEGVITAEEAENLIAQLEHVRSAGSDCLIEDTVNTEVTTETYFQRNGRIVKSSDELVAFQVNDSPGTQDTIDRAKAKGIPVRIFSYSL